MMTQRTDGISGSSMLCQRRNGPNAAKPRAKPAGSAVVPGPVTRRQMWAPTPTLTVAAVCSGVAGRWLGSSSSSSMWLFQSWTRSSASGSPQVATRWTVLMSGLVMFRRGRGPG